MKSERSRMGDFIGWDDEGKKRGGCWWLWRQALVERSEPFFFVVVFDGKKKKKRLCFFFLSDIREVGSGERSARKLDESLFYSFLFFFWVR